MKKLSIPSWIKFWQRQNKVVESIDRLTQALVDMEKARQKGQKELSSFLDDPEKLAEFTQRAYQAISQARPPVQMGAAVAPPLQITTGRRARAMSARAAKKAVELVTKAVTDKMGEMEKHIEQAIADLPPSVLQKIAKRVEAGEEFVIRRRRPDCITLDFGYGDEEYYLGL